MSKKVELIIEIDEKGKITVTPKGTVGKECLDLMSFLDKVEDFEVNGYQSHEAIKVAMIA